MADTESIEHLINAIKLTQQLRASVTEVFSDLSDGFHNTQGNEKSLLNEVQKSLCALNNDFNELEKLSAGLSAPLGPQNFTSCYLTWDPVLDKTSLYSQLLLAHKWTNKVQEVSSYAATLLQQNQLQKSQHLIMLQNKRMGRAPVSVHNIPANYVDNCVAKLDHIYPYTSNIVLTRPLGVCAVLEITIGKTIRVLVVLRGLIIEWVTTKGYHEDFRNEDGKLDIWSKSRHQVFQKVTEHCSAAMLHFFSPSTVYSDIALQTFYRWLSSYRTLFSASCQKCSKYLVGNLPPTWRDFRHMTAYHDCCRS